MTSKMHYPCLFKVWDCMLMVNMSVGAHTVVSEYRQQRRRGLFYDQCVYLAAKITVCVDLKGWCVCFCLYVCACVCKPSQYIPTYNHNHRSPCLPPDAQPQTNQKHPPTTFTIPPATRTEQMPLSTSRCPDGHRKQQCDQCMVGCAAAIYKDC